MFKIEYDGAHRPAGAHARACAPATKQYKKGATTHLANKQTPTYRRNMWAESDYDEGGPGGMVGNFRRNYLT